MKRKILLNPEGNWYKANLHCHCTVSDGAWTAEKNKEESKTGIFCDCLY